jgi:hypothetical protein
MSQQRLFQTPVPNKSVDILKVYTNLFSFFFTFQAFLASSFASGLKMSPMSKKKRKKMYARFTILITLGGAMLLCLNLGALVSQRNQSSLLMNVLSTSSSNENPQSLKDVSFFEKIFNSDHIGALPYHWFN